MFSTRLYLSHLFYNKVHYSRVCNKYNFFMFLYLRLSNNRIRFINPNENIESTFCKSDHVNQQVPTFITSKFCSFCFHTIYGHCANHRQLIIIYPVIIKKKKLTNNEVHGGLENRVGSVVKYINQDLYFSLSLVLYFCGPVA